MKLDLTNKQKIIIKIGSSLVVHGDKLRDKYLKNFAKNVAQLSKKGFDIVIITSGSIALGKNILGKNISKNISLDEKQAASAIGQIALMSHYRDFFNKFDINIAQILMTIGDCNSRTRYLNVKNTINSLLANKIIPIINENDSIAIDEIKIGDNDRLAARVAQMIDADLLILLSDIDGLFDENPKINENANFIAKVSKITKEIEKSATNSTSKVGTGGMITKIMAARMLKKSNCDVVITNGQNKDALTKIIDGKQRFTIFCSDNKNLTSRKNWISGSLNITGEVTINDNAKTAILSKKSSLLPVGVVSLQGNFKKGSVILIKDKSGTEIASGISNYSATNLEKILLKNSQEIKKILGKSSKTELVHIDNLVLS